MNDTGFTLCDCVVSLPEQADVGLALLAGHANANTTEDIANTAGTGNAGLLKDGSATGKSWVCVVAVSCCCLGLGRQ
jgi:hypothetical protein